MHVKTVGRVKVEQRQMVLVVRLAAEQQADAPESVRRVDYPAAARGYL